jgi:hypothetical protein
MRDANREVNEIIMLGSPFTTSLCSAPCLLFQFPNCIHSRQESGREISPSQGRYLNTGQHKHRINAHRHTLLEWNSNSRTQRSRRHEDSLCPRVRGPCDPRPWTITRLNYAIWENIYIIQNKTCCYRQRHEVLKLSKQSIKENYIFQRSNEILWFTLNNFPIHLSFSWRNQYGDLDTVRVLSVALHTSILLLEFSRLLS